jgi:hypothetical protein
LRPDELKDDFAGGCPFPEFVFAAPEVGGTYRWTLAADAPLIGWMR